ncbi:hypothetical protein SCLCIDRAFT_112940 [Scleroderma citrinum Foug A]|uniref:SAC domain-containing protein n=1 Tax=Scleroderma citrinum Foug A TaxID=1036808 RepID=A0A0C3EAH7_9AGAM|nr:hypothetical protein SCLCIDRAFT_112940 [Scleroderma citrinum Foug A]
MKRLFSLASRPSRRSDLPSVPQTSLSKSTVPPHLYPHEYIAVIASEDGLLMRPYTPGPDQPEPYVRVSWGKECKVEALVGDGVTNWASSVLIYGVIGILDSFNASYLLVITARQDVGCLLDESQAIYGVKKVTAIPLLKDGASRILANIKDCNAVHKMSFLEDNYRSGEGDLAPEQPPKGPYNEVDEEHFQKIHVSDIEQAHPPSPAASSEATTPTSSEATLGVPISIALSNRLSAPWVRLSGRSPTKLGHELSPTAPSVVEHAQWEPEVVVPSRAATTPSVPTEEHYAELEDRVVRGCIREYTKGCMFFAYGFDITRSLQHKLEQSLKSRAQNQLLATLDAVSPSIDRSESDMDSLAEPFSTLPLWKRVDRQFWWNEHLSRSFIDAGLDSYVLPVVQGHFQVANFNLPANSYTSDDDSTSPVDYIIASRRSRYRAGLRYQRRGIDDEAHVANFVETETIVKIRRASMSNVFSFVQVRGSVPLYWTQTGYSLRPTPVLEPERTPEQNLDAMKRHFQTMVSAYGPHVSEWVHYRCLPLEHILQTIVNLAEQRGKESTLCNAYKAYVDQLGDKDISYYAYDFHHETKGMKYERLTELIGQLGRIFENQGYFWVSDGKLLSKQKGVFRVNCIDCLDRTNVVQSSFARHVLGMQLGSVGLNIPTQGLRSEYDMAFNDAWANNGDAISRAYAGTSALKANISSRTGKRDIGGLLNDGVNSLARMYSATFSDWFCQAVIDFVLGYRTLTVFSEFLLKLQSTDPRELIRLSRIRAGAIATSVSAVLEEGETLLSGWTAFSPEPLNVKMGDKFEEKVLLLSVRAFYIVSFDYALEKVKQSTRVPLAAIVGITKGAYIISPLEEASRDPVQNAGFTLSWSNTGRPSSQIMGNSDASNSVQLPLAGNSRRKLPTGRTHALSGQRRSMPNLLSDRLLHPIKPSLPTRSQSPFDSDDVNFAAFKVLPVDPFRVRSGSVIYEEPADDLVGATTCKEVVDLMVDAVKRACYEAGNDRHANLVVVEDVVSLAEAQRATSMYAKVEYGVKRLLWLGG